MQECEEFNETSQIEEQEDEADEEVNVKRRKKKSRKMDDYILGMLLRNWIFCE